jgi:hypothetical protein
MYFSPSKVLGGVLSLAVVLEASAIPNIEERAASDICKRLDMLVITGVLTATGKATVICDKIKSLTRRDEQELDPRFFNWPKINIPDIKIPDLQLPDIKIPDGLLSYPKSILTQACNCLAPQGSGPDFTQIPNYPPSGQFCTYINTYYVAPTTSNSSNNYAAAKADCQAKCKADSKCKFVEVVKTKGFFGSESVTCTFSSQAYQSNQVFCLSTAGLAQTIAGYNKN